MATNYCNANSENENNATIVNDCLKFTSEDDCKKPGTCSWQPPSKGSKAKEQAMKLLNPLTAKAAIVAYASSLTLMQIWLPTFIMIVLFFTPVSAGKMTLSGGGKKVKAAADYSGWVLPMGIILFLCLVYKEYR